MTDQPPSTNPLRRWRQSCGWGVRDLEAATGIHRGLLSQYERGLDIPLKDMDKIAAALSRAAAK